MVSRRLIARHSVDFPDPDGPDDDDDLARADAQIDVLQHVEGAEVLVDVLQGDQRRPEGVADLARLPPPKGQARFTMRIRHSHVTNLAKFPFLHSYGDHIRDL